MEASSLKRKRGQASASSSKRSDVASLNVDPTASSKDTVMTDADAKRYKVPEGEWGEFNGAGPGVCLDADPPYTCSKCKGGFYFYGCLANTYGIDAKEFHRYEASAVTAAIGKAESKSSYPQGF